MFTTVNGNNSKEQHKMQPNAERTARPSRRLKSGSLRTQTVGSRLTASEEQELIHAAGRAGRNISEWTRYVLLAEARRPDSDPLFTELIATRLLIVNLLKPMLLGKSVPENWIVEAMNGVRAAKHKAAADLRKEYAGRDRKES
jgi:predicted phage gp36 major capsid-like protein